MVSETVINCYVIEPRALCSKNNIFDMNFCYCAVAHIKAQKRWEKRSKGSRPNTYYKD